MDRFERKIYETLHEMNTEEQLQDLQAKAEKPYKKKLKKKDEADPKQKNEEDSEQPDEETSKKPESAKDKPPVKKTKVVGTPELSDVIEQFNLVRSGRSVKDAEVKEQLKKYFNNLEDSEKIALFAFMKAFAELTSSDPAKEKADDPSDPPYYIDMNRRVEDKGKEEKGRPDRPKSKVATRPDIEQALDVPIVVGESRSREPNNVRDVLRKFLK